MAIITFEIVVLFFILVNISWLCFFNNSLIRIMISPWFTSVFLNHFYLFLKLNIMLLLIKQDVRLLKGRDATNT